MGRLPATFPAVPSATLLSGQFIHHVDVIFELGVDDFVWRALLSSLRCDFSFCTFQGGTSNTDALSEGAERHHGKSNNCNESFDGFPGHVPQVILFGMGVVALMW